MTVSDPSTGRPRWTTDVPFVSIQILRDGDRFYLAGNGFAARLNWRTGAIERIWSGLPEEWIDRIRVAGNLLIVIKSGEAAIAIHAD